MAISACPEEVGTKESNKNHHQRSRWEYTGSIREGKMEIPVYISEADN